MLEDLFLKGVEAVTGQVSVSKSVEDLELARVMHVLAVGKAAESMVVGALDAGVQIQSGFVVTKTGHLSGVLEGRNIEAFETAHPVPDQSSLDAGAACIGWLQALPADAELLFLVSGGASSLLEHLKPGVTFDELVTTNERAHAEGLAIGEINALRRELSAIKGGQLLTNFGGKVAHILYISDVEGDDIGVVGSGIGAKPEDAAFEYRCNIVASNEVARSTIVSEAERIDVQVVQNSEVLYENVDTLAPKLAQFVLSGPDGLYVFGGESTVNLPKNPGYGGRNQALALLFAREIAGSEGIQALFAGTDGTDGPTALAGAIVDGSTYTAGEGAEETLRDANAGRYFQSVGADFVTGPTGTNVMDLALISKTKAT